MAVLPEGEATPIVPTYSGTVQDLYTQVTALLLQNVALLSILSRVEVKSSRNLGGLPSWVPDYTCRFNSHSLATLEWVLISTVRWVLAAFLILLELQICLQYLLRSTAASYPFLGLVLNELDFAFQSSTQFS